MADRCYSDGHYVISGQLFSFILNDKMKCDNKMKTINKVLIS